MKPLIKIVSYLALSLLFIGNIEAMEVERDTAVSSHRMFSPKSYNKLPSVEDASQRLSDNGNLSLFLTEGIKIAEKHGLDDIAGVRLVHRHFDAAVDECIVESNIVDDEGIALVTRAEKIEISHDAEPASWIKTERGFEVFEFSRDPAVKSAHEGNLINETFLLELDQSIMKYGLSGIITPSIMKRKWDHSYEQNAFIFLEKTEKSESIVRPVRNDSQYDRSIRTGWSLASKEKEQRCMIRCEWQYPDGPHGSTHFEY